MVVVITALIRRYLDSVPPHVRAAARVTVPPASPSSKAGPVPKGTVLFRGKLFCREHPNIFVGHPARTKDETRHFPCPFC